MFVFNGMNGGWVSIAAGFMLLLYMMVRWFGDVIRESEGGKYGRWEDVSFRWGMSFFIFSEVMFFAAFFGALFWARVVSVPDLASIESNALMWPGYTAHWPNAGPAFIEKFTPMGAWGLPAVNTHPAPHLGRDGDLRALEPDRQQPRQALIGGSAPPSRWASRSSVCQAIEYVHAFTELNLTLHTGVYGSTFFMLTGFHGFHVTIGAIMLTVIWFRCLKGHFTPDHHFALRGRGLVLALRRRGLARPLYLRLLALKPTLDQAEVIAGHQHQE